MRPGGLTIVAGGRASASQLAALAVAVTAIVEEAAAGGVADPVPAAYGSRWRRAALLELSEVPLGLKDDVLPWRTV